MLLNEAGRVLMQVQCWRLTEPGVVRLRRAVGVEVVLCFFLEVFDHFMQGGHRHLQRPEQHCLPSLFHILYFPIVAKLLQLHENLNKSHIKKNR